jgi:hypothetical protein
LALSRSGEASFVFRVASGFSRKDMAVAVISPRP